jgi:predicted DNA-binding protein YlxM (UPF0122 family)
MIKNSVKYISITKLRSGHMEKNVEMGMLLDIYGSMLTKKQYELLNDYYNNDLSLSEIAENENITRQAVRDNLKKGEKKLFEFEEKLKVMKKQLDQEEKIASILSNINKLDENSTDEEVVEILEYVKRNLSALV